jgi:hypothetical protein
MVKRSWPHLRGLRTIGSLGRRMWEWDEFNADVFETLY